MKIVLVKGKSGSGKTSISRAACFVCDRIRLTSVINPIKMMLYKVISKELSWKQRKALSILYNEITNKESYWDELLEEDDDIVIIKTRVISRQIHNWACSRADEVVCVEVKRKGVIGDEDITGNFTGYVECELINNDKGILDGADELIKIILKKTNVK